MSILAVSLATTAFALELNCGKYSATGKLTQENGRTFLHVLAGTKSDTPIRLFGLSNKDVALNENTFVTVEGNSIYKSSDDLSLTGTKIAGPAKRADIETGRVELAKKGHCVFP